MRWDRAASGLDGGNTCLNLRTLALRPHGFSEALAAVAGALTSLLFVALSVKSDVLAAARRLRSCAAETLVLFMISVLIAVLLVAPRPPGAPGAELLAAAASWA